MKGSDEMKGKREEGKPRKVDEERGKARQADQAHIHREKKEYRTGTDEAVAREGRHRNARAETKGKIKCRREIARHNNGGAKERNIRRIEEEGGSRGIAERQRGARATTHPATQAK